MSLASLGSVMAERQQWNLSSVDQLGLKVLYLGKTNPFYKLAFRCPSADKYVF